MESRRAALCLTLQLSLLTSLAEEKERASPVTENRAFASEVEAHQPRRKRSSADKIEKGALDACCWQDFAPRESALAYDMIKRKTCT